MHMGRDYCLQGAVFIIIIVLASAAGCTSRDTGTPVEVSVSPTGLPPHPPHYLPLYTSSLVAMQKNLAWIQDQIPGLVLGVPVYMPDGFFFSEGTLAEGEGIWISPGGEGYCLLTYQRGQDEWVSLMERSRNQTECPDHPGYQAAVPGSLLAAKGATGELWWGGDGWCYNLSGTPPRGELETIAASVKPLPYSGGAVPPYEFRPPARPLVGTFAVNRSAAANGVAVTVESLHCTPEMCTAQIQVGPGPQPGTAPSPAVTTAPPAGSGPHAEWRVDGGRSLLTMPGGGVTFNATSVFWNIEPLPEGSRELAVNFTRVRGISGTWQIVIPLNQSPAEETVPADGTGAAP